MDALLARRRKLRRPDAVLRLRPCPPLHLSRRPGARALHALAGREASGLGEAARPRECDARPTLYCAAGLSYAHSRGALSDELRRRRGDRLSGEPCAIGCRRALLHPMLVPRSASSLHAARPVLGHVRPGGDPLAAVLRTERPASRRGASARGDAARPDRPL